MCNQPRVLFDGRVPTLTGLDGDMWASQLLTIQTGDASTDITFDFTDTHSYDRVERVEVVMFNCPQWGIASSAIIALGASSRNAWAGFSTLQRVNLYPLTSCDSFTRVCLATNTSLPILTLQFIQDSDWVHLAEVAFYARGSTCPASNLKHHHWTQCCQLLSL